MFIKCLLLHHISFKYFIMINLNRIVTLSLIHCKSNPTKNYMTNCVLLSIFYSLNLTWYYQVDRSPVNRGLLADSNLLALYANIIIIMFLLLLIQRFWILWIRHVTHDVSRLVAFKFAMHYDEIPFYKQHVIDTIDTIRP